MKRGCRWSRPSATCSTTSSTASSQGQSLAPTIHDALEIARLVQDLRRSQEQGPSIRQAATSA